VQEHFSLDRLLRDLEDENEEATPLQKLRKKMERWEEGRLEGGTLRIHLVPRETLREVWGGGGGGGEEGGEEWWEGGGE